MLGRNGNIAYVRYDSQGRIVAGGPIIQAAPPKNGNWQAVSNVLGTNTTGTNGNILRAFIRLDMFGRVVPSSLVVQSKEPLDANSGTGWVELNAVYRGTTTTTTSSSSTSTTTSTSTSTTTSTSTSTTTTTTTTPSSYGLVLHAKSQSTSPLPIRVLLSINSGPWVNEFDVNITNGSYNNMIASSAAPGSNVRIAIQSEFGINDVQFGSGMNSGDFTSLCGETNPYEIPSLNSTQYLYFNVADNGIDTIPC